MAGHDQELKGRVALITGGSSGIGKVTCLALACEGANIALNYTSNEIAAIQVQNEAKALGVRCEIYRADVSDANAVRTMVSQIDRALGPIDLLVTAAGIVHSCHHTKIDIGLWRRTMKANVDSAFLPVMAVKDGMIERGFGRIVCMSSIAGLEPRAHMLPYSTSSAAVIAFVRSCALAFAPNVRVNCLATDPLEIDMSVGMYAPALGATPEVAFFKQTSRTANAAKAMLYLVSERSKSVTGQILTGKCD